MKHDYGEFESIKFEQRRAPFKQYIEWLEDQDVSLMDLLEHNTAYMGHMMLNRILTFYELYKLVEGVAGHIAEVGVYKGAGSLLFAKLVKIFESESLTQVHGFDWFKGNHSNSDLDSDLVIEGGYKTDKQKLLELIEKQRLQHILKIHDLDIVTELEAFMDEYKHLQFKFVFMDAGMYEVMNSAIPLFWERLTPGGIMVFDQFNFELAPGETLAVRERLPGIKIKTIKDSWMPNAYAIKE